MENKEIFKLIDGFEYMIGNLGTVIRCKKVVKHSKGDLNLPQMKMKPAISKAGYYFVSLRRDYKAKGFLVHRLIAIAFIPNPENLPVVNHKDGNKLNISIDNLEWCTYKHNMQHALKSGLLIHNSGELVPNAKLKNQDVLFIRKAVSEGIKQSDLARKFKINPGTLNEIIKRKTWKHI